MSVCYKCKRCDNIETNNFTNLKKHLNRKNMCIKKKENFCYSNDQLLVYSLIPFQNDIQCISDTEIMHLQKLLIKIMFLKKYILYHIPLLPLPLQPLQLP